ncbi:unnamed protein product [Malus baccata var. baccata]
MELLQFDAKMLMSLVFLGFVGLFVRLYDGLVAKPKRLRSLLTKQGINGPPPTLLLGNIMEIKKARGSSNSTSGLIPSSHNCAALVFPFFEKWRKQYGEVFAFALGNTQILCVNQPDAVREITTCTSLDLGKPTYQFKERGPLLGQGILTSNGPSWVHQRKVIAPELYMDKVKGMINLITESTTTLVNSWNSKIETAEGGIAEIKIDSYMRSFSGDVISRACFGSNYSKGEEIFHKLRNLQEAMSKKVFSTGVPGMRLLPTKSNREAWALEKEASTLILRVVKERQAAGYEKDLLQMILEGAINSDLSQEATDRFIVDNCKNIYLAGYETTAVSATWCLMLLASNPKWQESVRTEALQVCQGCIPDNDMIPKMKQLTMVIHESLRLYPPVTVVSREAFKDMKFGDINIPKGVNVWTTVATLHTDPEIWGPDAYVFNPDRFANGITGACKLPHVYMPFGMGPRVCLGQNLAMVELKILIALLVSNFSFSLSPKYRHGPALRLVIEPEHGVDLLLLQFDAKVLLSLVLLGFIGLVARLYNGLVAKPKRLRSLLTKLEALAITTVNARPLTTVLLFSFHLLRSGGSYMGSGKFSTGEVFVFALGNTQILCVHQPDAVRDITTCTSLDLGKPTYQFKERGPLIGQGILTSNGSSWAHQRKIIAPELYMEKVKGIINLITESTITLINSWNSRIEVEGGISDIKIDSYMGSFSGDAISRACFGSNYSKWEEIFQKLKQLQEAMGRKAFLAGIPGMRHLPTKSNSEVWTLEKEANSLILQVVKERRAAEYEKDLLQIILEGAKNSNLSQEATDRFIVDNCKNIYLAGYETTAVSATWCLMLLASNQEWQERVRAEALQVCQGHIPDADMVRNMKQLTMVIHESLRLYPPVSVVSREAFKDMRFGDIQIPKGISLWIMVIITLHTDPELWGSDSYAFNPNRFANGITGAY